MRITHVITRLIVGGAQENTVASVLGLREKPDLEVDLITGPSLGPEGSLESLFRNQPEALSRVPELVRPVHPLKDWIALTRLTEIFKRTKPDMVHTHSGKAGVIGRLAAARTGVPVIIHTIHGPSFGSFQGSLANTIFRAAERKAGRVTTHFVSVADAMTSQYLEAGIGRPEHYTTIRSGFDLAPFLASSNSPALRERLGIHPGDFVVGKIARICALKGHDDLFAVAPELIRRCPAIKFLLVGDGEWRRHFEAKAQAMHLRQHFIFTGLVPPGEVPSLVGVMDILVHLSLREGLPRALPQALAAGKPVVAYDCDGAREVCIEGRTGVLLKPGDLGGLTDRVLQLAAGPELRLRLGEAGRELVREQFAVQKMVDDLHTLYLELARQRDLRT